MENYLKPNVRADIRERALAELYARADGTLNDLEREGKPTNYNSLFVQLREVMDTIARLETVNAISSGI